MSNPIFSVLRRSGVRFGASAAVFGGVLACGWFGLSAGPAAVKAGPVAEPPGIDQKLSAGSGVGATADGRLVIYGDDGLTPVFIEDPVDQLGFPIPVGPQHDAKAVRGRLAVARVPRIPVSPNLQWGVGGGAYNMMDGSTIPLNDRQDQPSFEEEYEAEMNADGDEE